MTLVKLITRRRFNVEPTIKAYLFKAINKKGYVHKRIMFKLSESMLNALELKVLDSIELLSDSEDSTQFAIRKTSDEKSLKIGQTGRNFTININNFSQEIRDKYESMGTTLLEHEIVDEGTGKLLKFKM